MGLTKVRNVIDITADTMSDLLKIKHKKGSVQLLGFHERGDGGGGVFYWDESQDKANHNGGTVIDPDNSANLGSWDSTSQTAWFTTGEGAGCWVRDCFGTVNVKWFGAKGDGSTSDTQAIQNAIDNSYKVLIPAGEYATGQLNITKHMSVTGEGISATRLKYTGDSICIKISTNKTPVLADLAIVRNIIGDVFNRTAIGIDVFGNVAAGSSVQPSLRNLWVEGFAVGLQVAGAWNSEFVNLTMKRNDVSYLLLNDCNISTKFTSCKSNNSVGKHIIAANDTSGATFIGCEFEDATRYPFFDFQTTVHVEFINCYAGENNYDDGNGSYQAINMANGGTFRFVLGHIGSAGKADARLMYARKGTASIQCITFLSTSIYSNRNNASLIDNEPLTDTRDVTSILGCAVHNQGNSRVIASYVSPGSQYVFGAEEALAISKFTKLRLSNGTNYLQGATNGFVLNANDKYNWENNCLIFSQNNGQHISYLWVDADGKLRIKVGTPTSNTDGDVVGTQS